MLRLMKMMSGNIDYSVEDLAETDLHYGRVRNGKGSSPGSTGTAFLSCFCLEFGLKEVNNMTAGADCLAGEDLYTS